MRIPNLSFNRPWTRPYAEGAYAPDAELQWWYFDAVLESGHRLLSFFLPRFLGAIEGSEPESPMVDVVLRTPAGEILRERRFCRPCELVASRDRVAAEFGADCSVTFEGAGHATVPRGVRPRGGAGCSPSFGEEGSGPGRYLLRARAGRIGYELEISPELPPWAPIRGGRLPRAFMMLLSRSLTTRDSFHYVPFVPRGRLRGTITVDGRVLDARGTAYHEQGRMNFPLPRFCPAWYWLHVEHPPWTLLSGTALPPAGVPRPAKGTLGGIGFVQKADRCLMAAFDPSGILVRWPRIEPRNPAARDGEESMAWNAGVRIRRPGLRVTMEIESSQVLEFVPFSYRDETPVKPYWGQTVALAKVEVVHGLKRDRFEAEAVLETMMTGARLR